MPQKSSKPVLAKKKKRNIDSIASFDSTVTTTTRNKNHSTSSAKDTSSSNVASTTIDTTTSVAPTAKVRSIRKVVTLLSLAVLGALHGGFLDATPTSLVETDVCASSPLDQLFGATPTCSADANEYDSSLDAGEFGTSLDDSSFDIFGTTPTPSSDDDKYDLVGQCSVGHYSLGRCFHATSLEDTDEFDESVDHSNENQAATTPAVRESTTPTNEIETSTPADLNGVPCSGRARQYWNQHEVWLLTIATFQSISIDLDYRRRQEHQVKLIPFLYFGLNWWHVPFLFLKCIMDENSAKSFLLWCSYLIQIGLWCGLWCIYLLVKSLLLLLRCVCFLVKSLRLLLRCVRFLFPAGIIGGLDMLLIGVIRHCVDGETYRITAVASLLIVSVATVMYVYWSHLRMILLQILMYLICKVSTWSRDDSTTSSPAETASSQRTTSVSSRPRKGRILRVLMFVFLLVGGANANTTPSKAVGKAFASAPAAAARSTKRKHAETSTTTGGVHESMQNDTFSALSDDMLRELVWAKMEEKNVPTLIQNRLFPDIKLVTSPEDKALIREFYIECLNEGAYSPIDTILCDEESCDLVEKLKELESLLKHVFTPRERTLFQLKALEIYKMAVDGRAFCYANKSCANGRDNEPSANEDTAIAHVTRRCNAFLGRNDDNKSKYSGRRLEKSVDVQLRGEQEKEDHLITTQYFKLAAFGDSDRSAGQAAAFYVELLLTAMLRMKDQEGQFHCLNRNYFFQINPKSRKQWHFAGITLFFCEDAMKNGDIGLNEAWDPEIASECFFHDVIKYTAEPYASGEDKSKHYKLMEFIEVVRTKIEGKEQKYTYFYFDDFEDGGSHSKHWKRYAEMIGRIPCRTYSRPTKRWELDLLHQVKIYPDNETYKERANKYIDKKFRSKCRSSINR